MFSDLAEIRAAVRARLEPLLPAGWRWEEYVTETLAKAAAPTVYLEFVRIDSTVNGQPLGRGQAAAQFNIIVAIHKTSADGEDDVDALVATFIGVLDHDNEDLYWTTADKSRLPTGSLAWTISAGALTLVPDPLAEPDPEPTEE